MTAWGLATTVLTQLVAQGVTDVVLSPGSRSAPLAMAARELDARGDLRLHVRVDERVAGFTALGLAKASGRVVCIITTSGTAVGNLTPAIMEADAAGVGVLALTADRPSHLVGTGANQTTNQLGQFGPAARAVLRLGPGGGEQWWRAAAVRAWAAASGVRTRQPGPVQLNLEFDAPLMPTGPVPELPERIAVSPSARGATVELSGRERAVVLVGDASVETGAEARALAELNRLPLFAEPSSNARAGDNAIASYRLLLGTELAGQIERVVVFGHPTLSRPVTQLLTQSGAEVIVVTGGAAWYDTGGRAAVVADGVQLEVAPPEWLSAWQSADRERLTRVDEALGEGLSGQRVAAEVVAAGGQVVFGSSNPIRDADLAPLGAAAPTWANRGLAGIDGTIATASGIALASGPTTLLLGDITFTHDLGALLVGPHEPRFDLRIVVADDSGGSIFATLEQGADDHRASFERVFATPTGANIAALAAAAGASVTTAASRNQLREALARPITGVEVIIVPIDRSERRGLDARLNG